MNKASRRGRVFSDVIFLQEGIPNLLSKRVVPYGLLSVVALVSISALLGGDALYLFAVPVMLFYSMMYSLLLHISIKSEFHYSGSYSLTMDNALLSFSFSALAAILLGYPAIEVMAMLGVSLHADKVIACIFGTTYFFYLLKLSDETYRGVDLDHLFGASFIPFTCACGMAYYVQGVSI